MAFVLPCISLTLVGFAIRLETKEMPLVVQNFDIGPAARELVDRIFVNNFISIPIVQISGTITPMEAAWVHVLMIAVCATLLLGISSCYFRRQFG